MGIIGVVRWTESRFRDLLPEPLVKIFDAGKLDDLLAQCHTVS